MASRMHPFRTLGDALFWSEGVLAGATGAEAPGPEAPWTVSPRTAPPSAEPVTVRSARPEPPEPDDIPVDVDPLAQSGEVPRVVSREREVDVDVCFDEGEEEPCPETLRSPVSEGVSPNVQRSRVASGPAHLNSR